MTHFLQRVRWEGHRAHTESSKNLWQLAADSLPSPGTHLITPRHGYNHHGIYVGDGKVMHYAGLCESLHRGPVQEVSIARFAAGQEIWVKPTPLPRYVGEQTVQRARSRIGENHYRLLTNNCEHFRTWCLYGQSYSEQVEECLVCPRMALHITISLFKAFLKARSKIMYFHIRTAHCLFPIIRRGGTSIYQLELP